MTLSTLDRLARQMLQERGVDLERYARPPKSQVGQRSLFSDDDGPSNPEFEAKHPREADGTFTDKEAWHLTRAEYHRAERDKPGYDVAKANRQYWNQVGRAIERGEQVPEAVAAEYHKLFGGHPDEKENPSARSEPARPQDVHEATPGSADAARADEKLDGGAADGKPDSDFDPQTLAQGTKHESEHTDDPAVAREIAKDHLTEDGDYYDKLDRIEGDSRKSPDPWSMTDDEAKAELRSLETKFAGPHGPANRSLTTRGDIEELKADGPRIEALRERLGRHFWQKTQSQVNASLGMPAAKHRQYVEAAIAEGKNVPPAVLEDYPDLRAKQAGRKPPEPNQEKPKPEVESSTTPHEPPEPDVPEIDDTEPPEEYLAYTPPSDLGERIKSGDAAAADEVMRRLDEQYPPDAQGPKADRAKAVRKKLVEDFGEKIGGARKDVARPLGPRGTKKPADERPGWARRYEVRQIVKSSRKDEEGKWALQDTKQQSWYGQPRQIGVFATEDEAKQAIPMAELSRTHGVTIRGTGDSKDYVIYRKVSDRKHPVVRGGFKTQDEAMRYMAQHPEEIIEHQFPRYEQYQYLDHVQRQGGRPRKGDVTPQDFQEAFGFRGGEFGNWQSGKDGQTALNHAYEALHDLADAIGWDPRAVTLNGDLAIAFGARGTGGKDAARAHYEPGARVINLTKMRGAGTLAHEFAHALDNYFARQATPPDAKLGKYEWVTEGLPYRHALRPEVAEAWTQLVTSLMAKEIEQEVDAGRVEKLRDRHWDHVRERLQSLEQSIEGDKRYNKRHKGLTAEQQKEWDAAKAEILAGRPGDRQFVEGRSRFGGYETYGQLAKLNQLYKAATGRSFHTADERNTGKDLFWSIQRSMDAEQKIRDTKPGATEKRNQQTDFLKEARKLDESRASSYYTVPTEMLARAFEAYVADKLAAKGQRSDYLVGKADNKFYRAFDMAPFPEGEERQAINAAFDRLFGSLQSQRWTDPRGEHVKLYSAAQVAGFARALYCAAQDRGLVSG